MSKKQIEEEKALIDTLKRVSDGLGHKLTREQVEAVYALTMRGANPEGIAVALKANMDAAKEQQK